MTYKMIPPKGLQAVSVTTERGTKTYKAGKDGLIHVSNPKHAAQMKHEGLGVAGIGGTIQGGGYPCKCGFSSVFAKCSKCGTINERSE